MVEVNRPAGSRYLWQFPMVFLLSGRIENEPGGPIEQRLLDEIAEDIAERRPAVIFVSTARTANMNGRFRELGFFRDAMAEYERIGPAGGGHIAYVLRGPGR